MFVDHRNLVAEPYDLTAPKEGMKAVNSSSDLDFWGKPNPHPDGEDLFPWRMNSMQLSEGVTSTSSLSSTKTSSRVISSSREFGVNLNAIFATLSQDFSVKQESKHTTTFSNSFYVTGFLPTPPTENKDNVSFLLIQPLLLKPKSGATEKPSWIPEKYKTSKAWLLTWHVDEVRKKNDPPPFNKEQQLVYSCQDDRETAIQTKNIPSEENGADAKEAPTSEVVGEQNALPEPELSSYENE